MSEMAKADNSIIEVIGNYEIRKTQLVKVRYNANEYKRLVQLSIRIGLPISKIIALSSQPCCACGNDSIIIKIPLGILSVKKQNSGSLTNNLDNNDHTR